MAAADLDLGLEDRLYDAEAAKVEACAVVNERVRQRMFDGFGIPFGEAFVSDLRRLFVWLVPVESVERCKMAHREFMREFLVPKRRLQDVGEGPAPGSERD
jgi:hypothetical protein